MKYLKQSSFYFLTGILFVSFLSSCALKPLKGSPTEKKIKNKKIKEEKVTLKRKIKNQKVLQIRGEKKKHRPTSKKGEYILDLGATMDVVSFSEDLDGETEINGRMVGTTPFLDGETKLDDDFNAGFYIKLGLFGEASFNQTNTSYTAPNTLTFGGFLIHESWDKVYKPIVGIEREEISYVSADKNVDLTTVNVFEQISGTKGLFWNAFLGVQAKKQLMQKDAYYTGLIGTSLLGESKNQKNELEESLRNIKLYGKLKWFLFGDVFIGGSIHWALIKGTRSTNFWNWSLSGGLRI